MPTSFGSPLKYEISRAAKELQVTRLLRAPQMLTTTSLDGVFWRPSLGSVDTRTFTMLVAAKTKKMCRCLTDQLLDNTFQWLKGQSLVQSLGEWNKNHPYFTAYPCGLCWKSVWPDFSAGLSKASAPCHYWYLGGPAGLVASSPAPTPHHSALMPTERQGRRSHKLRVLKNSKTTSTNWAVHCGT